MWNCTIAFTKETITYTVIIFKFTSSVVTITICRPKCNHHRIRCSHLEEIDIGKKEIMGIISFASWFSFSHIPGTYRFHRNAAHLCISKVDTSPVLDIYFGNEERRGSGWKSTTKRKMKEGERCMILTCWGESIYVHKNPVHVKELDEVSCRPNSPAFLLTFGSWFQAVRT